jgi:hypothetical protein
MTDTTIIEMPSPAAQGGRTPFFSWSAAIAGAVAATAVTFIIAALGSGIGLPFASPYSSGPSATGLTVAAAVWLVLAQALGFATGGYLAGRLRSPAFDGVIGERIRVGEAARKFRLLPSSAGATPAFRSRTTDHLAGGLRRVGGAAAERLTGRGPLLR